MLREDPAAFREMVFAGLRALETAGQPANVASSTTPSMVALSEREQAGPKPSTTQTEANQAPAHSSQLDAYRAFEKSANEELERSVGSSIQRALEQALPNISRHDASAPLQGKLQQTVREDVESALKSDAQLGEQLGRLLSARRFDETTRSQVVRLINDRAQQLVPSAARRVIQDWTQTTFAAHRTRNETARAAQGESAPAPNEFTSTPAPSVDRTVTARYASPKSAASDRAERDAGLTPRATARPNGRAVDYRKLSDEQILEM